MRCVGISINICKSHPNIIHIGFLNIRYVIKNTTENIIRLWLMLYSIYIISEYGGDWIIIGRFIKLNPSWKIIIKKKIIPGITNANTSGNIPKKAACQNLNFLFFNFILIDLNKAPLHSACEIISMNIIKVSRLKVYLYNLKISSISMLVYFSYQ
jgi:hypothetical protein